LASRLSFSKAPCSALNYFAQNPFDQEGRHRIADHLVCRPARNDLGWKRNTVRDSLKPRVLANRERTFVRIVVNAIVPCRKCCRWGVRVQSPVCGPMSTGETI